MGQAGTCSVHVIIFRNLDSAALRAMTGRKGESAIMLFLVFLQLLKFCGAIQNFACCPTALPLGSWFFVSQGVAFGLAYAVY